MKKKFFFFVTTLLLNAYFSLMGASLTGPSIVFVHIGEKLPTYLTTAIQQARLFNTCDIILVANKGAIKKARRSINRHTVTCVSCESLEKTIDHKKFLQTSSLDKNFRAGFWNHAMERFFYLQDVILQYNLKDVVHLESDNMLYVDISTLLPIFKQHYPHLAITLDNDGRCIPGFIYIANSKSINHLASFLAKNAHLGKTDMEGIALYLQQDGIDYANQLPIIMTSYVNDHELKSPYGHVALNKYKYCQYIDLFHSIFDAAAIGQYLGGIDPRNGPSQPGFINESCVFNPSHLAYEWQVDQQGRKVPYAVYLGSQYRINNLHIHCKNLPLFLSR